MGVKYRETVAKTLLRKSKVVDDWWWTGLGMNIYRGCEHACNYCDGRNHRYNVHDDFDETVFAKVNAPELLEKELMRMGFSKGARDSSLDDFGAEGMDGARRVRPRMVVGVAGGVNDPYQPAEERFGLTRKVLEVLRDFGLPVFVLTKSDRVLRDIDLLAEMDMLSYANVSFTVTTMDETIMERFEPRAPTTARRLEALRALRARGVHGGVMLLPMIPFIGDTEENIEAVVKGAKAAGAEFVLYGSMTLREEQRERMFSILECDHPGLVERYREIYKGQHWPRGDYSYDVHMKAHDICRRNDMPERVPRYIPEGALANNLKVAEVLCNMAFFMQLKDVHIEKVKAYRRAGLSVDGLQEDIQKAHEEDRLLDVPGIGKVIARDVSSILTTGTCPLYDELRK